MANTFLRKFSSNIGTSATSIGSYSVGVGTGAVVIGLTISNTSNNELNANVSLYNSTTEYRLVQRVAIPAGGSLVAVGGEQKLVLQPYDSIRVQTETGYGLDATMTIMETSSIGVTDDGDGGGSGPLEGDLELGSGTVDLETETGIEDLNA